jgi:hypothetical protein
VGEFFGGHALTMPFAALDGVRRWLPSCGLDGG